MKREQIISSATKELDRARTKYIEAQIRAESGWKGVLLKTGFKSLEKNKDLNYLLEAQRNYYKILDRYRRLIIGEFKKSKRQVIKSDIKIIAKLTIFDEIRKLRKEKEEKIRSKGLMGVIRTQVQEWREISTGFKMSMGLVLGVLAVLLNFFSSIEIYWLQLPLLGWGIIIFLEGAQQKMTRSKASKKGINRPVAYARAERRISRIRSDLASSLAKIHIELEAAIWKIRVFEKKTEYRRYIVAGLGGAFIGSFYLIPYGIKTVIFSSTMAVLSRGIWFLLPYGAIRGGLGDLFQKGPATNVAAAAEAAKNDKEALEEDVSVGEGIEPEAKESMEIGTRTSAIDPAYVKAVQANNINEDFINDVKVAEASEGKENRIIPVAKAAGYSDALADIIAQMQNNPVSLFYSGDMGSEERQKYILSQDPDYVKSIISDNIKALGGLSIEDQTEWVNDHLNDQSFWNWLDEKGFVNSQDWQDAMAASSRTSQSVSKNVPASRSASASGVISPWGDGTGGGISGKIYSDSKGSMFYPGWDKGDPPPQGWFSSQDTVMRLHPEWKHLASDYDPNLPIWKGDEQIGSSMRDVLKDWGSEKVVVDTISKNNNSDNSLNFKNWFADNGITQKDFLDLKGIDTSKYEFDKGGNLVNPEPASGAGAGTEAMAATEAGAYDSTTSASENRFSRADLSSSPFFGGAQAYSGSDEPKHTSMSRAASGIFPGVSGGKIYADAPSQAGEGSMFYPGFDKGDPPPKGWFSSEDPEIRMHPEWKHLASDYDPNLPIWQGNWQVGNDMRDVMKKWGNEKVTMEYIAKNNNSDNSLNFKNWFADNGITQKDFLDLKGIDTSKYEFDKGGNLVNPEPVLEEEEYTTGGELPGPPPGGLTIPPSGAGETPEEIPDGEAGDDPDGEAGLANLEERIEQEKTPLEKVRDLSPTSKVLPSEAEAEKGQVTQEMVDKIWEGKDTEPGSEPQTPAEIYAEKAKQDGISDFHKGATYKPDFEDSSSADANDSSNNTPTEQGHIGDFRQVIETDSDDSSNNTNDSSNNTPY